MQGVKDPCRGIRGIQGGGAHWQVPGENASAFAEPEHCGLPQCETCLTTRSRFRSLGGLRRVVCVFCDLPWKTRLNGSPADPGKMSPVRETDLFQANRSSDFMRTTGCKADRSFEEYLRRVPAEAYFPGALYENNSSSHSGRSGICPSC